MESSLLFVEIFYSSLLLSLATHLKQRNSVSNFQFGQNASFMSIICWKYIGNQNQSSLICSITSGSESKGIFKLFYYLFSASCKLIILFHLIKFWTQIPINNFLVNIFWDWVSLRSCTPLYFELFNRVEQNSSIEFHFTIKNR